MSQTSKSHSALSPGKRKFHNAHKKKSHKKKDKIVDDPGQPTLANYQFS